MHNPRLGLIRVLTTDNLDLLQSHERIIKKAFPQITIESRCIPDQFDGVHDDESEALAIPKVASLGRQFAQEGFDAVYVSCVGDPGVALPSKRTLHSGNRCRQSHGACYQCLPDACGRAQHHR